MNGGEAMLCATCAPISAFEESGLSPEVSKTQRGSVSHQPASKRGLPEGLLFSSRPGDAADLRNAGKGRRVLG